MFIGTGRHYLSIRNRQFNALLLCAAGMIIYVVDHFYLSQLLCLFKDNNIVIVLLAIYIYF